MRGSVLSAGRRGLGSALAAGKGRRAAFQTRAAASGSSPLPGVLLPPTP